MSRVVFMLLGWVCGRWEIPEDVVGTARVGKLSGLGGETLLMCWCGGVT